MRPPGTKGERAIFIQVEHELAPFVEAQLSVLRSQFKVVGVGALQLKLGASGASPPKQSAVRSVAVFKRRGAIWELQFGDSEGLLPDRKGLRHIHELLSSPGESIPALRLAVGREEFGRLREQRQEVLDRQALTEVHQAIGLSPSDEATDLGQHIKAVTGLVGHSRAFRTQADRARGAVFKTIDSALRAIERACPDLAPHLRASIDTGNFCVYRPIAVVEWEL